MKKDFITKKEVTELKKENMKLQASIQKWEERAQKEDDFIIWFSKEFPKSCYESFYWLDSVKIKLEQLMKKIKTLETENYDLGETKNELTFQYRQTQSLNKKYFKLISMIKNNTIRWEMIKKLCAQYVNDAKVKTKVDK